MKSVPPPPSPELRRLDPLIGEWKASDRSIDGPGGPAANVDFSESYRWLEGGYFLESRYLIVFGDSPPSYGVMYWGFDDESGRFKTIYFDDQGPFHEQDSRYEGVITDDAITFTGPARFRFPLTESGVIRVEPDGAIRSSWWLRDESGSWQPWRDATYRPAGRSEGSVGSVEAHHQFGSGIVLLR